MTALKRSDSSLRVVSSGLAVVATTVADIIVKVAQSTNRPTDQATTGAAGALSTTGALLGGLIAGPPGIAAGAVIGTVGSLATSVFFERLSKRRTELAHELTNVEVVRHSPNIVPLIETVIESILIGAAKEYGLRNTVGEKLGMLAKAARAYYEQSADGLKMTVPGSDDIVSVLTADPSDPAPPDASEEEWRIFLTAAAGDDVDTTGMDRAIEVGAQELARTFTSQLITATQSASVTNPQYFAGIELLMYRALINSVNNQGSVLDKVGERQQQTLEEVLNQKHALEHLQAEFAVLPDRITERIEGSSDASRALLTAQIEALRADTARADEHLAARLTGLAEAERAITTRIPSLADLAEHPWEPRNQKRLPFHFSGDSGALEGSFVRDRFPEQLQAFLDLDESFQWWLWTGHEGAGKSRLAAHACLAAISQGWKAGFLSRNQARLNGCSWDALRLDHNTLIVIDDVNFDPAAVRHVLDALGARAKRDDDSLARERRSKTRILLLERHSVSLSVGSTQPFLPSWFSTVFQERATSNERSPFFDYQYPHADGPSLHIPELDRDEVLALAEARATTICGDVRSREIAHRTLALLWPNDRPSQCRPLHVLITATMLAEGTGEILDSFQDVIRRYLETRLKSRREQLEKKPSLQPYAEQILNLVCLATLVRSIRVDGIEPVPSWLPPKDVAIEASRVLGLDLHSGTGDRIYGIEPDLIGEWFVRLWCDDPSPLMGHLTPGHLLDGFNSSTEPVTSLEDFVQRTYRSFGTSLFWRTLRAGLGRYSTPFGRLFDSESQRVLLGGTMEQADAAYGEAIEHAIEDALREGHESVLLVDLMAGGSKRLEALLTRFHECLLVLAIDRDTSRLLELQSRVGSNRLKVILKEIDGRIDLVRILEREFGRSTCDLVIAKKALHEIRWTKQEALIRELGEAVSRYGGKAIIYADSPDEMTDVGYERWEERRALVRSRLPDPMKPFDAVEVGKRLESPAIRFEMDSSGAAAFANFWVMLKDWANYNSREYNERYFSSRAELADAFGSAGFLVTPAEGATIRRFSMILDPCRFIEDSINQLGYLASDPTVSIEDLQKVVALNSRYELFQSVVSSYLWSDDRKTDFGHHVNADLLDAFDPGKLVRGILGHEDARINALSFPVSRRPSFEFPIHVLVFPRSPHRHRA